jgi:hypothetical protein
MTLPTPGVHDGRLQQLYTKLHAVTMQIKQEEARRHRRQELERVLIYGRLVLLAGLDGIAPEMLLGMLQESRPQMADATTGQRWQTLGTTILARDRRLRQTVRRVWDSHNVTGGETTGATVLSDALLVCLPDPTDTDRGVAGGCIGQAEEAE